MKNFWSHKLVILILFVSNLSSAAYIVFKLSKDRTVFHANQTAVKPKVSNIENYRRTSVREALLNTNDILEGCYENFLRSEPSQPQGAMTMNWMIDQQGHVEALQLSSSEIDSPSLIDCVSEHIRAVQFVPPPGKDKVMIAHKFNFYRRTPASLKFE